MQSKIKLCSPVNLQLSGKPSREYIHMSQRTIIVSASGTVLPRTALCGPSHLTMHQTIGLTD